MFDWITRRLVGSPPPAPQPEPVAEAPNPFDHLLHLDLADCVDGTEIIQRVHAAGADIEWNPATQTVRFRAPEGRVLAMSQADQFRAHVLGHELSLALHLEQQQGRTLVVLRAADSPLADGRVPQPGAEIRTLTLCLDGGRHLLIEMGQDSWDSIRRSIGQLELAEALEAAKGVKF